MRRLLVIVLLALPLVACFGGGDDDGAAEQVGGTDGAGATEPGGQDPDGPAGTTGPADLAPVVAEACAVFAGNIVRIVGEPERMADIDDVRAALEGLAAEGPDEVRATAAQLVEVLPIAEVESDEELGLLLEDMTMEEYKELLYGSVIAAEDLVTWAAPTCAPGELAWSCAALRSPILLATVGGVEYEESEPIPTTTDATTGTDTFGRPIEPEPVLDSVEAVIEDVGRDTEPVEVSRTDDRVEVGWLDFNDLVTETVIAEPRDGGWVRVGGDECPMEDE